MAVQAFKTYSIGARNVATVNEALLDEGEEAVRVGRFRASSSRHKEKMDILKEVIESRTEMCQTLKSLAESLMASKSKKEPSAEE